MIGYVMVAVGGALGSVARYWMAIAVASAIGGTFPIGTLLINIIGSGVIGLFAALTRNGGPFPVSAEFRVFVMVGICGGFTTFSSFSLQTLELAQAGEVLWAGLYVLLSVSLCLASVWGGYLIASYVQMVAARA